MFLSPLKLYLNYSKSDEIGQVMNSLGNVTEQKVLLLVLQCCTTCKKRERTEEGYQLPLLFDSFFFQN